MPSQAENESVSAPAKYDLSTKASAGNSSAVTAGDLAPLVIDKAKPEAKPEIITDDESPFAAQQETSQKKPAAATESGNAAPFAYKSEQEFANNHKPNQPDKAQNNTKTAKAAALPLAKPSVKSSLLPASSAKTAALPVESEINQEDNPFAATAPTNTLAQVKNSGQKTGMPNFKRPVSGEIISKFGPKKGGLYNDGINISAKEGTVIAAAEDGDVVYAGNELRGYGNMLLIKHNNGFLTAYAHTDDFLVKKGDIIKKGQAIAHVGQTGHVTTPQLHFSIRQGRKAIDPEKYLF